MSDKPDYARLADEFEGFLRPNTHCLDDETDGGWVKWTFEHAPAILSALRICAEAQETEAKVKERGAVYVAVERALDECSAGIARPDAECTRKVALAAGVAASQYFGEVTDSVVETAVAAERETLDKKNRQALALLRQSYVTLAFAFKRLHESARGRDGELCADFQKVRSQIESYFRDLQVRL